MLYGILLEIMGEGGSGEQRAQAIKNKNRVERNARSRLILAIAVRGFLIEQLTERLP